MLWSGWALILAIVYQTVRPQNISMRWPQAPSGWGILLNVNLTWDTFQRSCDSRNLNLEPLCTLETGPSPKLWLEEVVFKTFKKPFFGWRSFFKRGFRLRRFTTRQTTPACQTTSRASSAQRETNTLTLLSNCHLRWDLKISFHPKPRLGRLRTMHGMRTSLLSTSSLDRRLSRVRLIFQKIFSFRKNWREGSRWDRLSLSPPLAASLVFSLGSARSPSSRSSTGQPWDLGGVSSGNIVADTLGQKHDIG